MATKRRFTDDTNGARPNRNSKDAGRSVPFGEMRFVRIELTEAEKKDFRALMEAEEFGWDFIDECIKAGYKVTFNLDKNGGGVLASVRCETTGLRDAGLILTGRGSTAAIALAVAEYKNGYLADDDGWLAAETRRTSDSDDVA